MDFTRPARAMRSQRLRIAAKLQVVFWILSLTGCLEDRKTAATLELAKAAANPDGAADAHSVAGGDVQAPEDGDSIADGALPDVEAEVEVEVEAEVEVPGDLVGIEDDGDILGGDEADSGPLADSGDGDLVEDSGDPDVTEDGEPGNPSDSTDAMEEISPNPCAQASCSDGNPCTTDVCVAGKGCEFQPATGTCDDGNLCTADDSCSGGGCAGKPIGPCTDGNDCTIDACNPKQGCTFTGVADGAKCAGGGVCAAAKCLFSGKDVAVGGTHACAIDVNGAVKCWGDNTYGQLGDGTQIHRAEPVQVVGFGYGAKAIALGNEHSCAIDAAGGVKCWGRGGYLGADSFSNSAIPVDVVGHKTGVAAIRAGAGGTCAIKEMGNLSCWSPINAGPTPSLPSAPYGFGGVKDVAVGAEKACAIDLGGAVWCFALPAGKGIATAGIASGAKSIAGGGATTCVIVDGGELKCWGENKFGQLGLGNASPSPTTTPTTVPGFGAGTYAVAVGDSGGHVCAINSAGKLFCWGRNYLGQLGDGLQVDKSSPTQVVGSGGGTAKVQVGPNSTCSVGANGEIKCWGSNLLGKLGRGGIAFALPEQVVGLGAPIAKISAKNRHTCAVAINGEIYCWGGDGYGATGGPSVNHKANAAAVGGLPGGCVQVVAGFMHSCALCGAGELWCFGDNYYGQAGVDGTKTLTVPTKVAAVPSPVSLFGLWLWSTCVASGTAPVKCIGTPGLQTLPFATPLTSLDFSKGHACALDGAGNAYCAGNNGEGQLGGGPSASGGWGAAVTVTKIGTNVKQVSAGGEHTCAIDKAGAVWCWGQSYNGQLGTGTFVGAKVLEPVKVAVLGLGNASVAAGNESSCVVDALGSVQCWGSNESGQLGDGSFTAKSLPTKVLGLNGKAKSVVVGDAHACALLDGGEVTCWGRNDNGQLGDGKGFSPFPGFVAGFGQ